MSICTSYRLYAKFHLLWLISAAQLSVNEVEMLRQQKVLTMVNQHFSQAALVRFQEIIKIAVKQITALNPNGRAIHATNFLQIHINTYTDACIAYNPGGLSTLDRCIIAF